MVLPSVDYSDMCCPKGFGGIRANLILKRVNILLGESGRWYGFRKETIEYKGFSGFAPRFPLQIQSLQQFFWHLILAQLDPP